MRIDTAASQGWHVTFGVYEGFRGCTDRDPQICACANHSDPECEGCGEVIEDGQPIVTVTRTALPTISPDSGENWWEYHTSHSACSHLAERAVAR